MIATLQSGSGLNSGLSFWLPLADAGAGAVNTTPTVALGSGTATFVRATTAWTKLSSGLWASVASGTARSFYSGLSTAAGTYAGYLQEEARTNEVIQSRDMTQAAWTAVNITAAKDQVGIDGVTNSASSLTATAGNGTLLQVLTEASATRVFSAFVKRITGTGEIDMTEDGGLSWTNVTASINSSTYTQVNANSQAVLNPSIGFRIVTSGDKIAVDMCQNEVPSNNAAASTPIPTTTVAVTRNVDLLTYAFAGNASTTAGTIYCETMQLAAPVAAALNISFTSGISNALRQAATLTQQIINDGTTSVTKAGVASSVGTIRKRAASYGSNGMSVTGDGLAPATGTFDGSMANTAICIGCNTVGGSALNGTQMNVKLWTVQLTDGQLQIITT